MFAQEYVRNILEEPENASYQFLYQCRQVSNIIKSLQRKSDIFRPLTKFEQLFKDSGIQKLLSKL